MAVDAKLVAQLRELTGAGMMDAKKALEETNGNLETAGELLRQKGQAKAASKAERETREGRVHAYMHSNGKLGAMVEVLCETDFVARNEGFIELCNDLAMHVSASLPLYLRREDVSEDVANKERRLFTEEMAASGKPADIIEKIVEGKMNKFYSEVCLLEQTFIKDEEKTIDQLIKGKVSTLGENIQLVRFSRFQIGA